MQSPDTGSHNRVPQLQAGETNSQITTTSHNTQRARERIMVTGWREQQSDYYDNPQPSEREQQLDYYDTHNPQRENNNYRL